MLRRLATNLDLGAMHRGPYQFNTVHHDIFRASCTKYSNPDNSRFRFFVGSPRLSDSDQEMIRFLEFTSKRHWRAIKLRAGQTAECQTQMRRQTITTLPSSQRQAIRVCVFVLSAHVIDLEPMTLMYKLVLSILSCLLIRCSEVTKFSICGYQVHAAML